jgi:hypothetical protein
MEDFHFAMHSLGGDWSDTAAFGVSGFFTRSFCLMNFPFFLGGVPQGQSMLMSTPDFAKPWFMN